MQCFAFISVSLQDCPRASANISSLFIMETLSLDWCYLWSEGWLQYRAPGIRKTHSVEGKAALPRNELVYLSGPGQLNICLRDVLQLMKRGTLKNLGEGHSCSTLAQQYDHALKKQFRGGSYYLYTPPLFYTNKAELLLR